MVNKEDIVKIMEDSIAEVESKVKAYDDYVKNEKKVKRRKKIIYSLECALPYIISSFIANETLHYYGRSIFNLDEVKYYENVQTQRCSNGLEYVNSSKTESFKEYFFTSTPWIKDGLGNYSREEIYYSLENLDNYDLNVILAMTDEEIKELFPVIDKRKYIQNNLSSEDLKYDDNLVFIVTSNREYIEEFNRTQTISENILDIVICLIITIIAGVVLDKVVVRHRFSNKINASLDEIRKVNIKEYRKLLQIRQDNLNLLRGEEKTLKRGRIGHGIFRFTK